MQRTNICYHITGSFVYTQNCAVSDREVTQVDKIIRASQPPFSNHLKILL